MKAHIYCSFVMIFSCVLQKEKISGHDPEYVSVQAAAAAQTQLENINKSLEMNQGWSEIPQH